MCWLIPVYLIAPLDFISYTVAVGAVISNDELESIMACVIYCLIVYMDWQGNHDKPQDT
jgi:hypothetical protein